jgi:outer membrane biosynthesis protein TonB
VPDAEPAPEPVAEPAPEPAAEPAPERKPQPPVEPAPAAAEPTPQAPKARVVEARPRDEQPAPPAQGPGFFRRHLGSTIALGVGLAAAGAGIGFGVMAEQAQDDVSHQYDPATDDAGRNNALAANVLFGVAGAAAITAVVLFIVEPGPTTDDTAGVDVVATGNGALVRF